MFAKILRRQTHSDATNAIRTNIGNLRKAVHNPRILLRHQSEERYMLLRFLEEVEKNGVECLIKPKYLEMGLPLMVEKGRNMSGLDCGYDVTHVKRGMEDWEGKISPTVEHLRKSLLSSAEVMNLKHLQGRRHLIELTMLEALKGRVDDSFNPIIDGDKRLMDVDVALMPDHKIEFKDKCHAFVDYVTVPVPPWGYKNKTPTSVRPPLCLIILANTEEQLQLKLEESQGTAVEALKRFSNMHAINLICTDGIRYLMARLQRSPEDIPVREKLSWHSLDEQNPGDIDVSLVTIVRYPAVTILHHDNGVIVSILRWMLRGL